MTIRSVWSFLALFLILSGAGIRDAGAQQPPETKHSGKFARPSAGWVHDAVVYEVYLRSFSKEGTFHALEEKLEELKDLGVTVIWLMPIHPIGEEKRKGTLGSPYSVKDYYGINPEFGTLDDFRRLVRHVHALGMRIIIDLVANHSAWDNSLTADHPDWYTKDAGGNMVSPNADWTDVADFNYDSPGLRRSMVEMMKYWVRDVDVDGFRCDVSEMVPLEFWREARAELDSIKPVMLLSEGSQPEQHLDAFDLTYSWNLYRALESLIAGGAPPSTLDSLLSAERSLFPVGSLRLRFSTNHDETAWDAPDVVKFGPEGARLAAVVVNTIPGVPLLYNGQEVGNDRTLPLFEKVPIDWSRDGGFRPFYRKLYELRKDHPALRDGEFFTVPVSRKERTLAFVRRSASDIVLVILNFSPYPIGTKVALSADDLLPPGANGLVLKDAFGPSLRKMRAEFLAEVPVQLPAYGYQILLLTSW